MTKRAILSLSEETLKEADRMAAELKVSRSEYIRRALAAYADELRRKKEEDAVLREREEACRGIDRLREEFSRVKDPGWDPVKVIREWRDKDRLERSDELRDISTYAEVREDIEKP